MNMVYDNGANSLTFNPLANPLLVDPSPVRDFENHTVKPGMESIRGFFNGAGELASSIGDAAIHPAGRRVTGALLGVLSFTLAFKGLSMTADRIPGLEGDGLISRMVRGILSLGLALSAGMGAFELGNNGFDLQKTKESLAQDWDILGEMTGNGARALDQLITGGRIGSTVNTAGDGLNAAGQAIAEADQEYLGSTGARTFNTMGRVYDQGAQVTENAVDLALDTAGDALTSTGQRFDRLINHPPAPGK